MLPLIAALPREDPWQREVRWLEERLALACGYDQVHLTRESNNALVVRLETYVLLTAENAAAAVHRGLRGPGYPGSPRWCSGGPAEDQRRHPEEPDGVGSHSIANCPGIGGVQKSKVSARSAARVGVAGCRVVRTSP